MAANTRKWLGCGSLRRHRRHVSLPRTRYSRGGGRDHRARQVCRPQTAQKAADALVPAHDCDCPRWADMSAKVLVQAKCSAHHDIAVTYSRRELQDSVSAGTFAFYCERCNTYRVPTDEERESISRRLHDDTP